MRSTPRIYNEDQLRLQKGLETAVRRLARVEAWSNASTVTLRVVGSDENGSLKSETVKYGREYQGTRIRERRRWHMPAAYTKTGRSSRQRERPTKIKTVTVKQ
jgi:hypothetical protein